MKRFILPIILLTLLFLISCESDSGDPRPDSGGYLASGGARTDFAEGGGAGAGPGSPSDKPGDTPPAGQITAGEWNDLDHWDFWLDLQENEDLKNSAEVWGFHPVDRYEVQVADMLERPVIDAIVGLYNMEGDVVWQSRTNNRGYAQLWNNALNTSGQVGSVRVEYHGKVATLSSPSEFLQGTNHIKLNVLQDCPNLIDLMFVVDATGSMGDELEYLKSELTDVLSGIEPSANVRLSTVFYRDEGDEYITHSFPFTSNISGMMKNIQDQSAGGGGDYPEAVHTALNEAVNQMSWSNQATVRLLFLLLDAPPHDNTEVKSKLQEDILKASEKGIRIIPISASGIDKSTEFLLRSMAQLTQGTYVFVTDDSGIGNDHLEPTVGQYEVELLNEMLVRLINEYGAFCYSTL